MNIIGDPDGIEALKRLRESNREYLKFIITSARTNTGCMAEFKADDGVVYVVIYRAQEDALEVSKK